MKTFSFRIFTIFFVSSFALIASTKASACTNQLMELSKDGGYYMNPQMLATEAATACQNRVDVRCVSQTLEASKGTAYKYPQASIYDAISSCGGGDVRVPHESDSAPANNNTSSRPLKCGFYWQTSADGTYDKIGISRFFNGKKTFSSETLWEGKSQFPRVNANGGGTQPLHLDPNDDPNFSSAMEIANAACEALVNTQACPSQCEWRPF
jgi:hypothetical protein